MCVDIMYKWENIAAASISALFLTKSRGRWELGGRYISSAAYSVLNAPHAVHLW